MLSGLFVMRFAVSWVWFAVCLFACLLVCFGCVLVSLCWFRVLFGCWCVSFCLRHPLCRSVRVVLAVSVCLLLLLLSLLCWFVVVCVVSLFCCVGLRVRA